MSTTVAVKRKFPPPCWTRDEALVLIEAYRERWHALHRAFLKNPDWDAVAEKVTTSCPDVTPPKTSAQCRHKMEKLRQRHRAEKLRASSFPGGQFFSSWFYFEAMEALETEPRNTDQTILDHQGLDPGRGFRFNPSHVQNLVTLAATPTHHTPTFDSRVSSYPNDWVNQNQVEEEEEELSTVDETYKNYKPSPYTGRVKPSVFTHQEPAPRKFSKVVQDHELDENGEMWVKVGRGRNTNQGRKRGTGGISEVVSSIRLLGEGFMKIEKMKMDMVREIERMRVETEMKRNQLILESQRQIVDAFVKGLIETRKQPTTETAAE